MMMVGDGPEGQPTEGVVTLDDIADAMDEGITAPAESDESEESEEAEGSEAEDAEEADEEEEGDDDESEPAKRKFTIKHDGKEHALELSEAEEVEMLQKSFDYTKKTMALADKERVVEATKTHADEVLKHNENVLRESVDRLQAYANFMQSQIGEPPPITLAQQDAHQYLLQKEMHEARKGQLHQAFAEIQRLQEDQVRQREAWVNQKAEATEKVLRDTLTGWNDSTLNELSEYAGTVGLHPKSAGEAMLEPGFWQLIQKAKAYDAIQAQKAQMKPKAQLAKVDKPQAKNQTAKASERAKRVAAFDKNPSVDALADLLR